VKRSQYVTPFASDCGIILDTGADCPGHVPEGSPFNLCPDHFQAVYRYQAQFNGEPGLMPESCPICEEAIGNHFGDTWQCRNCGYSTGMPIDAHVRTLEKRAVVPVVYYIRFGTRIKIGTSINPRARMVALPHDEVLAFERGSYELESRRHEQFDATRVGRTEWFEISPALDLHIRKLRAGVSDPWAQHAFWVRSEKQLLTHGRAS